MLNEKASKNGCFAFVDFNSDLSIDILSWGWENGILLLMFFYEFKSNAAFRINEKVKKSVLNVFNSVQILT